MTISFKRADIKTSGQYYDYFMELLIDNLVDHRLRGVEKDTDSNWVRCDMPENRVRDYTWWSNNFTNVKWDDKKGRPTLTMFVEVPIATTLLKVPSWFPQDRFVLDQDGNPTATRKTWGEYGAIVRTSIDETKAILQYKPDTIFSNIKFQNFIDQMVANPSFVPMSKKEFDVLDESPTYTAP